MQAIVTKYFGATNFRGSRVKATCAAGSKTVSWDDAIGTEENHDTAAATLAHKLGWIEEASLGCLATHYVSGGLPDGCGGNGNAYVALPESKKGLSK